MYTHFNPTYYVKNLKVKKVLKFKNIRFWFEIKNQIKIIYTKIIF